MFLDTSGLMCLFDRRDNRHASAVDLYDHAESRITHNYVLAEFVALAVARRAPMHPALEFIKVISRNDEVRIVWVDSDLHHRAVDFLTSRNDKAWSLCDAVSFVVMAERGISDSLTTDHDFHQAGYACLTDRDERNLRA